MNQKANFLFFASAAIFLLATPGQSVPMGGFNKKTAKGKGAKITKLVRDLKRYNKAYRSGKALISDSEYDDLIEELRKLDSNHKYLHEVEVEEFYGKKVFHNPPMLSTEKTYTAKTIKRYLMDMAKAAKAVGLPYATLTITPKLDGIAIDWSDDVLSTRGNGKYGNDITRLVKAGVTFVPESMRDEEFRGELVIGRPYFNKHLSQYAIPRSVVAGIANAKTLKKTAKKIIDDGALHAVSFAGFGDEQIQIYPLTPENMEYILANLNRIYMELVNSVPYDCDGIVFSVIDEAIQEHVGQASEHWRYQIAYKVRGKQEATTVRDVIWRPGRYGYLTPLLIFDPVNIGGSKITRASAHNLKVYREKGLGPGAKIKILRSGEIIPYVSEIIKPSQTTPYPLNCPYCKEKTRIEGPRLICPNPDCSGTLMKRIRRFMEKMNIKQFGEATVLKLVKAGYKQISAVLNMTEADFRTAGFSEKMAKKLYKSLQNTYKTGVDKATLLGSFGIEGLGMTESKKLMTAYPNLEFEELDKIKKQKLTDLPGIGTKTANTIQNSLKQMQPQIDRIVSHDFQFNKMQVKPQSVLAQQEQQSFLFSGLMEFGGRKKIQQYAREKGHKVATSVSKNIDYLVVGEKPGASKVKKANKLAVKIITEKEFFDMVP